MPLFSFGRTSRNAMNGNGRCAFSHFSSFVLDHRLHSDLGVFAAQHFSDNSPHGLQDPCSPCFYSNSPVLLG